MAHRHGQRWRGSIQVPDILGPVRQGGFPTKAAAERWERETLTQLEHMAPTETRTSALSCPPTGPNSGWPATPTSAQQRSASGRSSATTLCRNSGRFASTSSGRWPCRRLVAELIAAGRAPKTVRSAHAVLTAVLDLALREGLLTANPTKGTRLPKNRRAKPRVRLTEQQVTVVHPRHVATARAHPVRHRHALGRGWRSVTSTSSSAACTSARPSTRLTGSSPGAPRRAQRLSGRSACRRPSSTRSCRS